MSCSFLFLIASNCSSIPPSSKPRLSLMAIKFLFLSFNSAIVDFRDFSLSISLKLVLSNSWLSIFSWSIFVASALLIFSPSPSVSIKVNSCPS